MQRPSRQPNAWFAWRAVWAMATASALAIVDSAAAQPTTMPQAPYGVPAPTGPGYTGPAYGSVTLQQGQPAMGRVAPFLMIAAQEGFEFIGPLDQRGALTYSTATGLQVSVVLPVAAQFGYQRFKVTVRSQQAASNDRNVEVELFAGGWISPRAVSVSQAMTLKAGTTSATADLLIPLYEDWHACGWNVAVDRRNDDELSMESTSYVHQQSSYGLSALAASPSLSTADLHQAIGELSNGSGTLLSCAPADFPLRWLHLTSFDLVILAANELPQLNADQAQALQRWVRAGGNLWLFECGNRWEEAEDVERALGLDDGRGAEGHTAAFRREADEKLVARGWIFVPLGDRALDPAEGALAISGFVISADDEQKSGQPADSTAVAQGTTQQPGSPRAPIETSQPYFAIRGYGLGSVTLFRGFFPKESDRINTVTAIQRSLLLPRLTSSSRYGNKPDEPNADFNNLLIPGVGTAPVGQFQFLITLFVLGIGPLNYWWLKRKNRLPLLLATVPAAAALVTLLLLLYGVLADGVGTRARVRSLTVLDQPRGEAATWARTTYYAGMSPRRGLSLPRDAAVFPILSEWSMGRYGRGSNAQRELRWNDQQQLVRGWLPSRTSTQYLTVSARPSNKRLDLRSTDQGLRVVNRLGATVTHLIVQDHAGTFYWGENLDPDQGVVLQPADRVKVAGRLRQLFAKHVPEFPAGAAAPSYHSYGMYSGYQLSSGVMEAQFSAINSPMVDGWGDGSYLAVTDRGVEVDLGLDDVAEEASFHLIQGRWAP